jgi:hypothetical protein
MFARRACFCGGTRRNWPGNPGFHCRPSNGLNHSPERLAHTQIRSQRFERRLRIRGSNFLMVMRQGCGCIKLGLVRALLGSWPRLQPSPPMRQSQWPVPRQPGPRKRASGVHRRRECLFWPAIFRPGRGSESRSARDARRTDEDERQHRLALGDRRLQTGR